jgi:hypothetical protein
MADMSTTYGLGVKITGECVTDDNVQNPITLTLNASDITTWFDGSDADGLNNDYKWIADLVDTNDGTNFPGWLHSAGGTDNTLYIEGKDVANNVGNDSWVIKVYDLKAAGTAVVLEGGASSTDEACTVTDIDVIGSSHVICRVNNSSFNKSYVSGTDEVHVVGNLGKDEYTIAEMEGNDLDLSGMSEGSIYLTFRFMAKSGSNIWVEVNKTITLDMTHPTFTITAEGA